jgi:hypothetical protein
LRGGRARAACGGGGERVRRGVGAHEPTWDVGESGGGRGTRTNGVDLMI